MRIAFVGKGGSGKTTLASLLIHHLREQNREVLAIDADINQHLAGAIGIAALPQKTLGIHVDDLKRFFAGTNPRFENPKDMIKTTPPGTGSVLVRSVEDAHRLLPDFSAVQGRLLFMATGVPTDDDVAVSCYHSKTGAVELLLNHLMDGNGEYVVVDMTAGADAFASGLFDKFDLTVVVVEPTQKSVGVFRQYAEQARKLGVHVRAVGNKVLAEEDRAFLRNALGDDCTATFSFSGAVRASERGETLAFNAVEAENRTACATVQSTLDACMRDWSAYLERSIAIHKKNALSWANAATGKNLEEQIDPLFRYPMD